MITDDDDDDDDDDDHDDDDDDHDDDHDDDDDCKVVPTFETVDETLKCDRSNDSP